MPSCHTVARSVIGVRMAGAVGVAGVQVRKARNSPSVPGLRHLQVGEAIIPGRAAGAMRAPLPNSRVLANTTIRHLLLQFLAGGLRLHAHGRRAEDLLHNDAEVLAKAALGRAVELVGHPGVEADAGGAWKNRSFRPTSMRRTSPVKGHADRFGRFLR